MASEMDQDAPQSNGKATGGLKPPTALLASADADTPGAHPHFIRSLALRFAEEAILLIAVVGAIAMGLGITSYFTEHRYVLAYLAAYAGFRFADLIVREDAEAVPHTKNSATDRRELPILVTFAAAPFERTYIYGGSAPAWVSALGLLIALWGCGWRLARAFSSDFSLRAGRPSIRCSSRVAFIVTSGIRSTRVDIW